MKSKILTIIVLMLGLLPIFSLTAYAQSIHAMDGRSVTISSDQNCTEFHVLDGSTLTVNQGVTLTLNISNGNSFNLFDNSTLQLHGTLAGSVASGATWSDNTYINVYLSDGAKYTVTGLTCMDGDNYLRYYGYDAATDGNGTVSVTSGSTAVSASTVGFKTNTYTFTATPASGYRFVNWTKGAGGEELGTDASIDVTCEQNGQYQVYANFAQTPVPITVRMAEGTEEAANWSIASGNVSVDGTQVLENVMSGSQVTATYNGTQKVKSVKAVKYVPSAVLVDGITLNKTATTITAGQTETLSVSSVTPDNAADKSYTWSSDNEAVATVDADGKVTAVALGTANITATANDGSGVTATCAVTVSKVVTINQSDWGSGFDRFVESFTKDGVTVSAGSIDTEDGNLMEGGTFSTTLGNFTKIVVTTFRCYASGTGWSGNYSSKTWTGTPASTVSFSGDFMGMGMTQTTIVCTIEPAN